MRKILKKVLFILSIFVFSNTLLANESEDLKVHFVNTLDKVILVVKDNNLSHEARNSNIIKLLTPMFDFELMAKLSLGKKVWNSLSPDEKDKFISLYVNRMKNSYSSKIDSYKDEKIEIVKIELKKNRIAITTDVKNKHESLEVIYKYYKPKKEKINKDTWLIYDVEIIGVSILKADKAQFREYLKNKSINQLMDELVKVKKK